MKKFMGYLMLAAFFAFIVFILGEVHGYGPALVALMSSAAIAFALSLAVKWIVE